MDSATAVECHALDKITIMPYTENSGLLAAFS